MKRYQFSLATVLRARRAQEEAARLRLAQANRELRDARLAFLAEADHYRASTDWPALRSLEQLRRDRQAAEHAAARLVEAREALEVAGEQVADRQAEWTEAARRVAALERLEDRRRQEWWAEVSREEHLVIDDIVNSRWAGAATQPAGRTA